MDVEKDSKWVRVWMREWKMDTNTFAVRGCEM